MISKEEIESTLNKCDTCNLKECINCEVSYTEIQKIKKYIEQLETREQKLIEMLEKDIINITKVLQDGKHSDDYSRCRLKAYRTKTKEILKILKGENDE